MKHAATRFGLIGALRAFPRRLAAREVMRQGGSLRRGMTRRAEKVVFGRGMLDRLGDAAIEARWREIKASGAVAVSENGFLRLLGIADPPSNAGLGRQQLLDQSGLSADALDLLALFDAFEADRDPFSFRDLILARKYSALLISGTGWGAVARSIHRSGPVASLTALSLHSDGEASIYARHGERLAELNGQHLLPLEEPDDAAAEAFFEAALDAEGAGRFAEAVAYYGRCLALDGSDSVAAFNRANCLRELGDLDEAGVGYMQAIKVDPSFVEAWFNYAGLLRSRGLYDAARRHLLKAVEIDPTYADAIYNIASLEYDLDNLAEARLWWERYLGFDQTSDWARLARRGIQYADLALIRSAG